MTRSAAPTALIACSDNAKRQPAPAPSGRDRPRLNTFSVCQGLGSRKRGERPGPMGYWSRRRGDRPVPLWLCHSRATYPRASTSATSPAAPPAPQSLPKDSSKSRSPSRGQPRRCRTRKSPPPKTATPRSSRAERAQLGVAPTDEKLFSWKTAPKNGPGMAVAALRKDPRELSMHRPASSCGRMGGGAPRS